ncbi:MAG: methyltransferase domain-containing protein [Lachnospiraceae bacterium]|nr:methyltransferase domain-containing protein [Lachnospiraceae bacterium]
MSEHVIRQWNEAAESYAEEQERSAFAEANAKVVRERFGTLHGEYVLDLGCGYGRYTDRFNRIGGQAIGVDGSQAMLDIAKKKYPGVTFDVMDITKPLPFPDERFDIVFCNQVLMDIENVADVLAECARILKPGGVFWCSIVHPAFYNGEWTKAEDGTVGKRITSYITPHAAENRFWGETTHYHRPLSFYLNAAADAGLMLRHAEEPKVYDGTGNNEDIPLFLYAEFKKPGGSCVPEGRKAYYHLPGLFEFYEFYKVFLRIFRENRECFYEWCEIGSIYGAPQDCLWGGGRVGFGDASADDVIALMNEYGISARLMFSNSLLREEHLSDKRCNALCRMFEQGAAENGIIVASDLLLDYIRKNYPGFYAVSSTTKVLTDPRQLTEELNREEFRYVVPDFRLNKAFGYWSGLSEEQKRKVEFLCNECCWFGCHDRKNCYENVSRKSLGEDCADHVCVSPTAEKGYRFSDAMENPGFIGFSQIRDIYLPAGFNQFKLEGRSLGSAVLLEILLYYMVKPEYQLKVRETVYLDSMLDLF